MTAGPELSTRYLLRHNVVIYGLNNRRRCGHKQRQFSSLLQNSNLLRRKGCGYSSW